MESEVVASVADTDEVYTFLESRVYYSVMRLPCKRSRLCGKNSSPSSFKKDAVPFCFKHEEREQYPARCEEIRFSLSAASWQSRPTCQEKAYLKINVNVEIYTNFIYQNKDVEVIEWNSLLCLVSNNWYLFSTQVFLTFDIYSLNLFGSSFTSHVLVTTVSYSLIPCEQEGAR